MLSKWFIFDSPNNTAQNLIITQALIVPNKSKFSSLSVKYPYLFPFPFRLNRYPLSFNISHDIIRLLSAGSLLLESAVWLLPSWLAWVTLDKLSRCWVILWELPLLGFSCMALSWYHWFILYVPGRTRLPTLKISLMPWQQRTVRTQGRSSVCRICHI